MNEHIRLIGAEDVQRAGLNMAGAAQDMARAAALIDETLERHRLFMDDWLARLAAVLDATRSSARKP